MRSQFNTEHWRVMCCFARLAQQLMKLLYEGFFKINHLWAKCGKIREVSIHDKILSYG